MKKAFLLLSVVAVLVACKKEEDTTRPVINTVKVNGVEANEHDVNAGTQITVEVTTSDNEELNQLKVEIHSADDGHAHEGGSGSATEEPNVGVWSDSRIIDLSGTSKVSNVVFDIPNSVKGHWHIEVALIDDQGNEATEYVTTLHVSNGFLPVLSITSDPTVVNDEIAVALGGQITLNGTVDDTDGIASIHVELKDEATGTIVWEYEVPGVSGTSLTLVPIVVGPLTQAGDYHLHLHATDNASFESEWSAHVHVE
jgi:hypothetical protein